MVRAFSPGFIAPVVGYLTSEANSTTNGIYEVSGGWAASYRWQRTFGHAVSSWPDSTCTYNIDMIARSSPKI